MNNNISTEDFFIFFSALLPLFPSFNAALVGDIDRRYEFLFCRRLKSSDNKMLLLFAQFVRFPPNTSALTHTHVALIAPHNAPIRSQNSFQFDTRNMLFD